MHSRTYVDPADPERERPSLIAGLMTYPSAGQQPRENQISEALCWLVDRSRALAEATVALFLTEAQSQQVLAAADGRIGASTRIGLAAPPGAKGPYRPDIWIAGANRSFQLMIEVKVTASEHWMLLPAEGVPAETVVGDSGEVVSVIQKEAYRRAWSLLPAEADARFVGLLSRDVPGLEPSGPARGIEQARNVTWRELGNRFSAIAESVEPEIRVVLDDFLHALTLHVSRLGPAFTREDASRALAWGTSVLSAAHGDRSWLRGQPQLTRAEKTKDAFGFHIHFRRPEKPFVDVHAFATHPDGHPSLISVSEPAFYLLIHRDAELEFSGWQRGAGLGRYVGWRLVLPFSQVGWRLGEPAPPVDEVLVERVTTWIRTSLEACGLGI